MNRLLKKTELYPTDALILKRRDEGASFHNQIHYAAGRVAFHVGSKRLGYFEAVEHLAGENIEGDIIGLYFRDWVFSPH